MTFKITRDNFCEEITYWLLALSVISIPFTRWLMLPIALLMVLVQLCDRRFKKKCQQIRAQKRGWALLAIAGLFIATAIGTIYAPDVRHAFSDWDCKIWFAVAPLCILPIGDKITSKRIPLLLGLFCVSTICCSIGNMAWSLVDLGRTGEIKYLFYGHATHFIGTETTHPSYLSMYCVMAWTIICYALINNKIESKKGKIAGIIGVGLLTIEIALLESKAGWLVFCLVLLCTAIYALNYRKRRILLTVLILVALCAGSVVAILHTDRMHAAVTELREGDRTNPTDGTLQRVLVWQTAQRAIAENFPLGTGTGASRAVLCQSYEANGYTHILAKRLNCHNQYLESTLEQGIIGILALSAFLIFLIIEAIKRKDFLMGIFFVVVALNFLVEAMLEARAGSNFIPLMATLLYLRHTMPCAGKSE